MYLKERLAGGECLIGAGIYSNSVEMLEFAAEGMDWIWWEAQHAHGDWQTIISGVRMGYAMRIPVLVRTWTHDFGTIEKLLDTGAEGIIVPMVNTPEQASEIVSHCYYPPVGIRSHGSIRMDCVEKDADEWNKRVVTIMMIETPQAMKNAEAIANVPGVDGLLIGAEDLSLARGKFVDSKTAHAKVKDDVKYLTEVCRKTGKAAGVIALSPEDLVERLKEGYQLICADFDVDHARNQFRLMREVFNEAIGNSGA